MKISVYYLPIVINLTFVTFGIMRIDRIFYSKRILLTLLLFLVFGIGIGYYLTLSGDTLTLAPLRVV